MLKISKSTFKNLIRCPRYYSFFKNDPDYETNVELVEMLGESNFASEDEDFDIEALSDMNAYYTQVEIESSKAAIREFGGTNVDLNAVGGQIKYSFTTGNIELFSYADIINVGPKTLNFIEVKSCTSSRFQKLGPVIDGNQTSIFQKHNNIFMLKEEFGEYYPISEKKYATNRKKLLNKYDDVGKYVYDLSIQRYIYENSSSYDENKTHKYYLAILNKDYVFNGFYVEGKPVFKDIENQSLINFVNLTKITEEMQVIINDDFNTIKKYIAEVDTSYSILGKSCFRKKITECKYLKECCTFLNEDEIIGELSNMSYNKIASFYVQGKVFIKDLSQGDLINNVQKTQRDVVLNNSEWIDKDNIRKELEQLEYPLYHLDFETFTSPLPRFQGETPSSAYIFQFSIHVEKRPGVCDEDKNHIEFLAKDHSDYRKEIAKLLVDTIDLSKGGTVIAWHKSFEISRMKELASYVPKYKEELLHICDHVYDLKDMFKGKRGTNMFAYRKEMKGSFSIKYVLPAYTDISYSNMGIGNGLLAMAAYGTYPILTKKQLSKVTSDLIKYCKQDTWAMVKLLSVCRDLVT